MEGTLGRSDWEGLSTDKVTLNAVTALLRIRALPTSFWLHRHTSPSEKETD